LFTAAIRAAICFRVNPSGKMMRRTGLGGAVSSALVSASELPPASVPKPTPATAHAIAASRPKPTTTPNNAARRPPRFRR
jgi:hypothetical protein